MLWEVEIQPKEDDRERLRIGQEYALLTHRSPDDVRLSRSARGFLIEGNLEQADADRLASDLLIDRLVETARVSTLSTRPGSANGSIVTVLLKPGVMDPVAMSVVDASRDLGVAIDSVRTFRRYYFSDSFTVDSALRRVLANDAIEQIVAGPLALEHLQLQGSYDFKLITVPIRELSTDQLQALSVSGQLSLSLAEMQAIQAHFRSLGREPTDVELETLAQTWSEHCSHKTLKGAIDFGGERINNLLKETIFAATQEIRRRLGPDDWCISVFEDNAGIVRFDDRYHVCFKVETHNHPSAIEPYGGANTGIGGVIRDPLGTGLGAQPVANTDVFCFAAPDTPVEDLPEGVLHPRKVMHGVVAGVRDYGNRMGIPTVNGAVCFDPRYLANPLVFCGTIGLIPIDRTVKKPQPGDLIVVVGGRTGRDGIHGATFSSVQLTAQSETASSGAVQIGNAITEKKMLDAVLAARESGLYHAITDCGAGGFSSAVGEMAQDLGALIDLDKAPLKYEGLSYTEIWISESQERMILAVPPENWHAFDEVCRSEDVEAVPIGTFKTDGALQLRYRGHEVGNLDMHFLHHGRPTVVRQAVPSTESASARLEPAPPSEKLSDILLRILGSYNVCSKEWIIRQYDHEVQGGSVIKPLVGADCSGPGDAAVITPVLGSERGLAIGCGINPRYGDIKVYRMAAAAVDEAVRNVIAVGADPAHIAILDNFCWGNTDRPEVLGSLVEAARACRDVALAYGTPFISGKDSLNNEYHSQGRHIAIPPTLLISALGRVPDVTQCVTMDLKEPGNVLFLLGTTRNEMGGSHYNLITGREAGAAPATDLEQAPRIFALLHQAIRRGLIRACHDLSEGGLAVAIAEMAFAGDIGADIAALPPGLPDWIALFAESTSRFLIEVRPDKIAALKECLEGIPLLQIGKTCKEPRLRIAGASGEWLIWTPLQDLKTAWQSPLRW
jgi:phosphoribosylformylglycinamidine synthase